MIKRIELVNFMSHEHSVFELTEGLNVLVGPNNCGKSAVVTALQILCYNETSKYVVRHESKECSVLVETDDGHVVRWSRKKNGSPWYEIDDQRFDRLGRNGVPDRLHEVLRLDRVASEKDQFDVHFGEQRNPVFLLNEKPRQAADFFASSSDARHLMEMQALHKQNVRETGARFKQLQRESAEISASLELLQPLDNLVAEMEVVEELGRNLSDAEEQQLHLHNLRNAMSQAEREIEFRVQKLQWLDAIPDPPELTDETGLADLIESLQTNEQNLHRLQDREAVLEPLTAPPDLDDPDDLQEVLVALADHVHDVQYLSDKLKALESLPEPVAETDVSVLEGITDGLEEQLAAVKDLEQQLEDLESGLEIARSKMQDWTSNHPECPTCGGRVTVEQLISRGGHQHGTD